MKKYVSKEEAQEMDRCATEEYNWPLLEMMEEAGKHCANFVKKLKPDQVLVLYGSGHNGGGGLVTARYLKEKGVETVLVGSSDALKHATKAQLERARAAGVEEHAEISNDPERGLVIVDALIGYSIDGSARGRVAELIDEVNILKTHSDNVTVVSLDIPSGMDPDDEIELFPHIHADYTLALAAPKACLQKGENEVGEVKVVDIGIPKGVYEELEILRKFDVPKKFFGFF